MKKIGLLLCAVVSLACVAEELETSKWQAAIDAASEQDGGIVVIPKGRHVVGQLYLKSNVELHLDEGATLEGAVGLHNYVAHTLPFSEGTWSAVVMGLGVTNVAITGKGEIFGNGAKFEPVKANGGCSEGFRPRGVFFSECRGIRLEDFTLRDAACWGIVLKCCDGMTARRVKVNSVANLNNDGFDIEAKNVLIEDCDVDSGDDAYCIKSNNPDFTVENVTVRNCIARSHCNGYKLGTASHGTMRGIRVEHCRAAASRRVYRDLAPMPANLVRWPKVTGAPYYLCGPGISAICVECVDGGVVENVTFDDIEVAGFQVPVFVRGGTRKRRACGTPPSDWHVLRNVTISNVRGRAEQMLASSVTGVKGCRPSDIVLRNFDLECVGEGESSRPIREPGPEMAGKYPEATMFKGLRLPSYGLYVDQADGVSASNLTFRLRPGTFDVRPAVFFSKDASRRLPASPAGEPQLRMGVLSDIHLTCRPKADETFLKALRYFRDRGADAVMIAGDIANSGRVAELKMCADAWYSVFPGDKAPDGRKVERLFVLGNHCVEAWKWGRGYTSPIKDEQARLADALGHADNRRKAWRELFHEEFEPIWMKTVRGFTVIGAHWEKAGGGIGIEAFMKAHAKDIDPTKPFFYVQHEHPKDTCFGAWAWGHDDGRSTRALSAFPNAIAFSGHSHYSLTDERTVWQGAFTSCNTASLFDFSMDYALRENAPGNRFGYTGDKGRPRRMKNMQSCEARQGQFLTVFADRIVIERRDFAADRSLGDDFVLTLPLGREKPCAYLPRSAARAAPEFPEGAKVAVAVKENAATDTVYEISFPHAETRRNCRVFEYEVTATLMADGVDLVQLQRRVIAPDFHLADVPECHRRGVCLIASADLPLKGDYVFSVRPIECFGHKGAAITSAVTKVGGPTPTKAACAGKAPVCIDGIYPHLAMFNDEGECGTGAVVSWAGSLWAVTYGPHLPAGSSDKLYEITPDLKQVVHPESIGGTPANRMIHRETNQLLIGPYVIDANGKVRVVPYAKMPGRLTGAARHLVDPARKAYVATMETGLYELDMVTLEARTLVRENGMNERVLRELAERAGGRPLGWESAPITHVPGYHAKGLCSGFGKVFVANNGENSAEARKNPFVPSGALAWWNRCGDDWRTVRRCQFTEVTTKDGIYGNEHPGENPIWTLGWDAKSVILAVTTNGDEWVSYRLPKASHAYDGAHGWNTEWPRIRDIGERDLLATMHGTFWRFPRDFSPARPNGIRPLSTYLKVIGDFCRWGDRVVFGCDDQAQCEFLGKRSLKKGAPKRDRSQSNLWFVKPEDLTTFGPPSGEGWVWLNEDVKAGTVSDPFLYAGYDEMRFEFRDGAGSPVRYELLREGDWVRVKAHEDVTGAVAHFRYGPKRPAALPSYDGFVDVTDDDGTVHRFPNVNGDRTVVCREVATERDLLYAGGVFYEVPADNAGGFRALRPIALASEPVRTIEAKLGLVYINGKPMAVDALWKNGTAGQAYWLWEDLRRAEDVPENCGMRQADHQFSLPSTRTRNTVRRAPNADRGWIQAEIDRVAAQGGGRVTIPAGVHETGSIRLLSHVELHLEKGAVISGRTHQEDYDDMPADVCPITPEFSSKALVLAWDAEDIAITGEGTIDGNGPQFYDPKKFVGRNPKFWQIQKGPRPRLVQFARCRNVRLSGPVFKDAAAFTMYMRECENVTVDRVAVIGDHRITNGDGIDLDGCRRVRIGNSTFSNGDDSIVLRAIRSRKEPLRPIVCEDVVVSNCLFASACQAIRIGCPSDDTIRNVLFKDIRISGRHNGIYFGNHLYCLKDTDEGLLDAHDITFDGFSGSQGKSAVQILVDAGIRIRRISDIVFRNFDVSSGKSLRFKGTAAQPIGRVVLENFKAVVEKGECVTAAGVEGLVYRNVTLNGKKQPDGPVAAVPGSSEPLVRKPSVTWDNLN